jgi:molecular chaperone DnaJ
LFSFSLSLPRFGHDAEHFEQAGYGPGPGFNPEDLLRSMFGGGFGGFGGMGGGMGGMGGMDFEGMGGRQQQQTSRQGADLSVPLTLTFMEAVNGCKKTLSVKVRNPCEVCDATGVKPGTKVSTCSKCGGTGTLYMTRGMFQIAAPCSACGGSGKKSTPCGTCHGETTVSKIENVTATIPAGVDTAINVRMVNAGDAGYKRGPRGHLWIKIKVEPHEVFRRDGDDVHVDAHVPFTTALLGGYVEVPTLTASVNLKVLPGSTTGTRQVMRNKGIKSASSSHYGSQFIHLVVDFPTKMSPRAVALAEELQRELYPETAPAAGGKGGAAEAGAADDGKTAGKGGKDGKDGLFSKIKSWGHKKE